MVPRGGQTTHTPMKIEVKFYVSTPSLLPHWLECFNFSSNRFVCSPGIHWCITRYLLYCLAKLEGDAWFHAIIPCITMVKFKKKIAAKWRLDPVSDPEFKFQVHFERKNHFHYHLGFYLFIIHRMVTSAPQMIMKMIFSLKMDLRFEFRVRNWV